MQMKESNISDISQRKKLEEDLRVERDLNRRYLEVASVMFVVLHANQEVALINRKGCEILGYERDEIIGRNWFDLVTLPEEADRVKEVFARLIRGELDPVESFENHVLTKTGEKRLIGWTNNYNLDDNGAINGIISCGLDITEKRHAEEKIIEEHNKLEAVMAALDEGITLQDRQFKILYQNKQHQAIQGGHCGEYCYSAYQQKDGVCPGCLLVKCFEDGQVHRREAVAQDKDGNKIYMEVSASPVRDAKGKIVAGIEAVRDISDRKKLEHEAQLARNLESLGVFAGGIAHDFNNLLTGIMGNLSFAQHQLKNGQEAGHLMEAMAEACIRAQKLTRQLLTFAKGGAPVIAAASVEEIATNSTKFILRGSKVKVEARFPEDLWNVTVDSGQISQVFQNLAQNAEQAMPTGGVIEIQAENVVVADQDNLPLAAGHYVKLSFKDNGIGMEPQVLPKIFDPYFTTKEDGSGLGLAISFSIIHKHHGHLEVASKRGMGTTFTIWLPASLAEEVVLAGATSQLPEVTSGQGRIMVMDDQEMIRNLAAQMLQVLGYSVEAVGDGNEMLERYRGAMAAGVPFDAVIMDLTIPGGMGGEEAVSHLLELDPRAKAIVSSGYSNDSAIANYAAFGFRGVIAKPFTLAELSSVLEEVLKLESAQ